MNKGVIEDLKALLYILKQCVSSFQTDLSVLQNCQGVEANNKIVSGLVFKISKLSECAKKIQKLLKGVKEGDINCFSCLKPTNSSLPNQNSKHNS